MNIPRLAGKPNAKPAEDKPLFLSGAHKRRAVRAYERMDRKRTARANAGQVQIDLGLRLSARQQFAMAAWLKREQEAGDAHEEQQLRDLADYEAGQYMADQAG